MTEQDARFLGSIPELYDRHLGPVIFEPYARDLAGRVGSPTTGSVLEIACGTGILTAQLRAHLAPAVDLVATDLNEPMIDYARRKPAALRGIAWKTADASALPFPPASFHVVACQFGFMFVPEKETAFREVRRVLKDGGLLAFNVWDDIEHNPFGRIAHATIAGFFPTDPPAFYKVPFGFHDPEVLRALLDANRFDAVKLERVKLEARSPSARSLAIGIVKGNPVSLAIEERGGSFDEIIDAVTAELTRAGGDNPFRSTMQALVVTAHARGT